METRCDVSDIGLDFVDTAGSNREAFLTWVKGVRDLVAIDLETTGLQPWGPNADTIRLWSFGTANQGWAVAHRPTAEEALRLLNGIPKTNWNSKFDESFLIASGLPDNGPWHDGMIAHHLLYSHKPHSLKSAASTEYGREIKVAQAWLNGVKRQNRWDWKTVPVDHPAYWSYGALDTVIAFRLSEDLIPEARRLYREAYDRERKIACHYRRMEQRGLSIDVEYSMQLIAEWSSDLGSLRRSIHSLAGIENPSSRLQLADFLLDQGWEPDEFTETGQPSTNKAVMGKLAKEGFSSHLIQDVLDYKRKLKYINTYLVPFAESGGLVNFNLRPMGAKTGRSSVSNPPLQQLPKGPEIRRCVLAEEGHTLYAADFTAQEMRLICAFAGDPSLTESILTGADIHGRVAEAAFGPEWTKEQRGYSKNALYARLYGAQPARIARTLGVSTEVAMTVLDAMNRELPGLAGLMERIEQTCELRAKQGEPYLNTIGGRRIVIDKKHASLNFLVQGSAADITKMAVLRAFQQGIGEWILLPIHDELLISVEQGQDASRILEAMEYTILGVPMVAHLSQGGQSWGEICG